MSGTDEFWNQFNARHEAGKKAHREAEERLAKRQEAARRARIAAETAEDERAAREAHATQVAKWRLKYRCSVCGRLPGASPVIERIDNSYYDDGRYVQVDDTYVVHWDRIPQDMVRCVWGAFLTHCAHDNGECSNGEICIKCARKVDRKARRG
ncbi:hypothetical protein [Streptomyces sp. NPDC054863]